MLIYLRPDISASERFADAKLRPITVATAAICRVPRCWRASVREVDSRLPSMLAALLAEDTKPETLRKMLASFLEIQPASPPRQPRQQPPRLRRRSRPRR